MPSSTRSGLLVSAALLVALAGCKPPPESVKLKEAVSAPPDLVAKAGVKQGGEAFQLRAFHLNHIWSGPSGRKEEGQAYRAKITLWDYDDGPAVAELYFHDGSTDPLPESPDPATAKRPYQVHFPMSAFGSILATLRNTNEPIFLYHYDGSWAIGTYSAEPVGSD